MEVEYCADVIALFNNKLVLVNRLSYPKGYALPGGGRDVLDSDELESVEACAIREFNEETGLKLKIEGVLGVYDSPNRDPRGPKISTTVYGKAEGVMRDEPGKTRVFLMDLKEVDLNKDKFCFDHYRMIKDWLKKR